MMSESDVRRAARQYKKCGIVSQALIDEANRYVPNAVDERASGPEVFYSIIADRVLQRESWHEEEEEARPRSAYRSPGRAWSVMWRFPDDLRGRLLPGTGRPHTVGPVKCLGDGRYLGRVLAWSADEAKETVRTAYCDATGRDLGWHVNFGVAEERPSDWRGPSDEDCERATNGGEPRERR